MGGESGGWVEVNARWGFESACGTVHMWSVWFAGVCVVCVRLWQREYDSLQNQQFMYGRNGMILSLLRII